LVTTGIAQTTPAAVPITAVITSMSAISGMLLGPDGESPSGEQDRGRTVGSRVNGRILEAELRHDHPVRALPVGGADSMAARLPEDRTRSGRRPCSSRTRSGHGARVRGGVARVAGPWWSISTASGRKCSWTTSFEIRWAEGQRDFAEAQEELPHSAAPTGARRSPGRGSRRFPGLAPRSPCSMR
jgi:hypothetical protein